MDIMNQLMNHMEMMKSYNKNHTEKFLSDMVAGGYKKDGVACHFHKIEEGGNALYGILTVGKMFWIDSTILLDPEAWKCVAKIRGWDALDVLDMDEYEPSMRFSPHGWLEKQHQFINLRSDGMSIDEALGNL